MLVERVNYAKGFSLIELIAGIVAFSAVMVVVITLVVNQSRQSIDPIWQTRASELAQSLAAEISGRAFDENSSIAGELRRCSDAGSTCTAPASLGQDSGESDRSLYDDIDDYNGLDSDASGSIDNALGDEIEQDGTALYRGFRTQVSVMYDNNFDAIADASAGSIKRVEINITTPDNANMLFSFYRRDY